MSVTKARSQQVDALVNTAEQATTGRQADTVKLTVALPRDAVAEIERIADKASKTKTQVLREAIALKAFVERELEAPGTRLLIERDGVTREIVFT